MSIHVEKDVLQWIRIHRSNRFTRGGVADCDLRVASIQGLDKSRAGFLRLISEIETKRWGNNNLIAEFLNSLLFQLFRKSGGSGISKARITATYIEVTLENS